MTDYAKQSDGRPWFSPCCGQAMTESEPHDTASTLQCVLCDRVYQAPQPPKLGRETR